MFDNYIMLTCFKELDKIFPSKLLKDIAIEINQNTNFPDRPTFITIDYYYKEKLILSCPYDMYDVIKMGKEIKFEEDAKHFKDSFKNNIFQKFCDSIVEIE